MNQGLKLLAIQAQKHEVKLKQRNHLVLLPLFAFLDELLSSLRKFVSSTRATCSWAQFLAMSLNDQQFSNIYASWLQHNLTSLQSKLLSTLLPCASISKINTFLKLRKLVLKLKPESNKNLDIIQLQHEDIIGIVHTAYKYPETKKKITDGVKNLFISYHMQQAKICSCVFIEYVLSLHNELQARQNNEATVTHQNQQFGTIPQSILGYSSIISHNSRAVNPNQVNHLRQSNQRDSRDNNQGRSINTSQYISNFQSIIHNENGLYRKIKSSQVSLQGFRVIDHKFHSNYENYEKSLSKQKQGSNSRNNENNISIHKQHESIKRKSMTNSQIYKSNHQKSQNNNSNYGSYQNMSYNQGLKPIQESPGQDRYQVMNQSKKTNSPYVQDNSGSYNHNNQSPDRYLQHQAHQMQNQNRSQHQYRQKEFSSGKRRGIEVQTLEMRDPNYKNNTNMKNSKIQQNSPSYSQRFKSPDMSYQLTSNARKQYNNYMNQQNGMDSSVVKQLSFHENPITSAPHERQKNKPVISPIKIEQTNTDREHTYALRDDRQSGYEMWKRLTQRNKSFMERMLKPDYSRVRTIQQSRSRSKSREIDGPLEQESSPNSKQINVIHESNIKSSKMSQWNNPGISASPKINERNMKNYAMS